MTIFTLADPDSIEKYDFPDIARRHHDEFERAKSKVFPSCRWGALVYLAIDVRKERCDRTSARVISPSIYALTEKTSPESLLERPLSSPELAALRDGFIKKYIDPHKYVKKIADNLSDNMDAYVRSPGHYVAPYTSLVTSSMMGKTRLMKELTKHHPVVYMCFRKDDSTGFPLATRELLPWFQRGACGSLGINLKSEQVDIKMDNDFVISTLRHSLFLLFLSDELKLLITVHYPELERYGLKLENFEWMWDFFAMPIEEIQPLRHMFWENVKKKTDDEFARLRQRHAFKGREPHPNWALSWLKPEHKNRVRDAHQSLLEALGRISSIPSDQLTLILCFDEARHLCMSSAVADPEIRLSKEDATLSETLAYESRTVQYSNFQAMRRGLLYLSLGKPMIPRVFGLFADTMSRLTSFQARRSDDDSSRIVPLHRPGDKHFDPIHVFTSIDAHARVIPNYRAISDHTQVATPERLLKFGRAGWYSLYSAKPSTTDSQAYDKDKILSLAIMKLVGSLDDGESLRIQIGNCTSPKLTQKIRLRLLAIFAPRLALTVGPFTDEASEVVSSHLAVLLHTDSGRHFLRTFYPSEPVLAEASAVITASVGWDVLLKGLYHQIQNGIVSLGYRGELLTKVLCLMAMDDTPKPFSDKVYWGNTQPVKVRDFLDHWIRDPLENQDSHREWTRKPFSSTLIKHCSDKPYGAPIKEELDRFMNGYVFFNHFIRVAHVVSLKTLAVAWNRGAAIMCKENTEGFDHVIPVMLASGNGTPPPMFGRMFRQWTDEEVKLGVRKRFIHPYQFKKLHHPGRP